MALPKSPCPSSRLKTTIAPRPFLPINFLGAFYIKTGAHREIVCVENQILAGPTAEGTISPSQPMKCTTAPIFSVTW